MAILARSSSLSNLSLRERWRFASKARPERYWEKQPDLAAMQLERVCKEYPDEWVCFYFLADYALKALLGTDSGTFFLGTAISAARRAHEINPNDSRTAFALATTLRTAYEYPGACGHPLRDLDNATFSLSRSDAISEAIKYFERTIELGVRGKDKRIVLECLEILREDQTADPGG